MSGLPDSPSKRNTYITDDGTELSSCLKANELTPSRGQHKSTPSQVRFSLPLDDSNDSSSEEVEEEPLPMSRSPTKIVFPQTSLNDTSHFMDMSKKVMVEVPQEIWEFHQNNKQKHAKSKSTSESPFRSQDSPKSHHRHERTQSLQSLIVNTINSYSSPSKRDSSSLSATSPLRLPPPENHKLYLRPDSPLNKFRVPIPLEISVPPYLSPENKDRHRNSLIYDGTGYSVFLQDSDSDSEGSNATDGSTCGRDTSVQISDISIPSATHDFSFDLNDDTDGVLGIDNDANVSLKTQVKNLAKNSPSKVMTVSKNKIPLAPVQNKRVLRNVNDDGAEEKQDNSSLQILSTPSKTITIPDLDKDPTPVRPNSGLKFFKMLDDSVQDTECQRNGQVRDQLNRNFKFPAVPPSPTQTRVESRTAEVDEDFVKATKSPENPAFEQRRRQLQSQVANGTTPIGHRHRRSRSIHNVNEIFIAGEDSAASTLPSKHDCLEEMEVPKRSPLRASNTSSSLFSEKSLPQSMSSSPLKEQALSTVGLNSLRDKDETILHENFTSDSNSDDFSFVHSMEDELQSERSERQRHNANDDEEEKSPSVPYNSEFPHNHRSSASSSTTSLACDFFEADVGSDDIASDSMELEQAAKDEKLENDGQSIKAFEDPEKSIELISERKIEAVKPLSTYHSFQKPLITKTSYLPLSEEFNLKPILKEKIKNRLAPSRQLSNNYSHSSYDSKDSARTYQSCLTSYCASEPLPSTIAGEVIVPKDNPPFIPVERNANGFSPVPPQEKSRESKGIFQSQDSACNSSPSLEQSNTISSKDGFKTIFEKHGNKMVEVIVLDDEKPEEVYNPARQQRQHAKLSNHENRRSADILVMCEQTADHAKRVILELTNGKACKQSKDRVLNDPLPPLPSSVEVSRIGKETMVRPRSIVSQPAYYSDGLMDKSNYERYVSNLNRSLKARGPRKSDFSILNSGNRIGSDTEYFDYNGNDNYSFETFIKN